MIVNLRDTIFLFIQFLIPIILRFDTTPSIIFFIKQYSDTRYNLRLRSNCQNYQTILIRKFAFQNYRAII